MEMLERHFKGKKTSILFLHPKEMKDSTTQDFMNHQNFQKFLQGSFSTNSVKSIAIPQLDLKVDDLLENRSRNEKIAQLYFKMNEKGIQISAHVAHTSALFTCTGKSFGHSIS